MAPLISALVPSRRPVKMLLSVVSQIRALFTEPDCCEWLIRIDDDYPELATLRAGLSDIPHEVLIGPRGNGYDDLHLMYNECASASRGDWLWILNDDLIADGPIGLDLALRDWPSPLVVLKTLERNTDLMWKNKPAMHPIISRKCYRAIGVLSAHCLNDSWIDDVYCQRYRALRVCLEEWRLTYGTDDMAEKHRAVEEWERRWGVFHARANVAQREMAAARLLVHCGPPPDFNFA